MRSWARPVKDHMRCYQSAVVGTGNALSTEMAVRGGEAGKYRGEMASFAFSNWQWLHKLRQTSSRLSMPEFFEDAR